MKAKWFSFLLIILSHPIYGQPDCEWCSRSAYVNKEEGLIPNENIVNHTLEAIGSTCFKMLGDEPEYFFNYFFEEWPTPEIETRFTVELYSIHGPLMKRWVSESPTLNYNGQINRMFDNDRSILRRERDNLPDLLRDFERTPTSVTADVPKEQVCSEEIVNIKLSNFLDRNGVQPQPWNRVLVHAREGEILNGVPLSIQGFRAFQVGNGEITLKYQGPKDECLSDMETIDIFNSCDIVTLKTRPLRETTVKNKIGEITFKLKCLDKISYRKKDLSCRGREDGEIKISVRNTGVFSYSLDGHNYQKPNVFKNLKKGLYTIYIKEDISECEIKRYTRIKEPEEFKVDIIGDGIYTYCKDRPEVVLKAEAKGGTAPYKLSWPEGKLKVERSGSYPLIASDANECETLYLGAEVEFKKVPCSDPDDDPPEHYDPDDDNPDDNGFFFDIPIISAGDPNEIAGPPGYQPDRWVSANDTMMYTIYYENDPEIATAPAKLVYITQPVDSNLQAFSFRIGNFGFGDYQFSVPPNTLYYSNRLDFRDTLGIYVDVTAGFDVTRRALFWRLETIDPKTGLQPAAADIGFLPVNDSLSGAGEGFVSYAIQPLTGVQTGDSIAAQATIIFDINEPIPTNVWRNRVDAVAPVSQMAPLPETIDTTRFVLSWSGQDDPGGVGVASFDLYVSENGTPFQLLFEDLDTTNLTFWGEAGHTYDFYTRARDYVGNLEESKSAADATITIEPKQLLTLDIPLEQGWNLISSFVTPDKPEMLDLLLPVYDDVILLKDGSGNAVIPEYGINNVGDWSITEGYQIKVTIDTLLPVSGLQADPLETPIPIVEGWQMVAYLRDTPGDIATEMAGIQDQITLVKNNAGQTYIPAYGINDIGNLVPMQGYQLKSSGYASLFYSANSAIPKTTRRSPTLTARKHFDAELPMTGRNATLILPQNVVGHLLNRGDEVGVFTSDGQLCGSVVYEDRNIAVTIWGDDLYTKGEIEGLEEGEVFAVRFWNRTEGQEYFPDLAFSKKGPIFETDGIYLVERAERTVTGLDQLLEKALYFKYFPNPVDEQVFLQLELSERADVHIDLLNMEGKYIANMVQGDYAAGWHSYDYETSLLSPGLYLIRLQIDGAYRMYKLTVIKK